MSWKRALINRLDHGTTRPLLARLATARARRLLRQDAALATAQTQNSATLTWSDGHPAGVTYNVYRAQGLCSGTPVFAKNVPLLIGFPEFMLGAYVPGVGALNSDIAIAANPSTGTGASLAFPATCGGLNGHSDWQRLGQPPEELT
jgi:hypothetical protein